MKGHEASRVERIAIGMTLAKALSQCGISVTYAIAGPSELFDVAGLLLDSPAMKEHDREVAARAWQEGFDKAAEDMLHHDRKGWGSEDCVPGTNNPYEKE